MIYKHALDAKIVLREKVLKKTHKFSEIECLTAKNCTVETKIVYQRLDLDLGFDEVAQ